MPLDPRKTVFVGGVPRPLKACKFSTLITYFYTTFILIMFRFSCEIVELAMIMDRLYGGVCYAGIDTDPELKYPKVIIIIRLHILITSTYFFYIHLFIIFRELVALPFLINRAILLPFLLALFNYNIMTLTSVLKLSHTFSMIKCVMNVKVKDVVENLHHSFVQM